MQINFPLNKTTNRSIHMAIPSWVKFSPALSYDIYTLYVHIIAYSRGSAIALSVTCNLPRQPTWIVRLHITSFLGSPLKKVVSWIDPILPALACTWLSSFLGKPVQLGDGIYQSTWHMSKQSWKNKSYY